MVITKKEKDEDELLTKFMKEIMEEYLGSDEILVRDVVAIGNGAHVNVPLKHLGKSAKIIIYKKKSEEKDNENK